MLTIDVVRLCYHTVACSVGKLSAVAEDEK